LFGPQQMELAAERLTDTLALNPQLLELARLFQKEFSGDVFSTRGAVLYAKDPQDMVK
jgi:hypothetical protein